MVKCTWYYGAKNNNFLKCDVENMQKSGLSKILFYTSDMMSVQSLWDLMPDKSLEIHLGFSLEGLYSLSTGQSVPRAVLSEPAKFTAKFPREMLDKDLQCWSSVKDIGQISLYLQNIVKKLSFVKGINIDNLRYPNTVFQEEFPCECEGCQERRKAWLGRGILAYEDLQDPSIMYKEIESKVETITRFVKELAAVIKGLGLEFSICGRAIYAGRDKLFNPPPTWGYGPAVYEGQDWVLWCRQGILDTIHFMNYSPKIERFERIAKQHKALLKGYKVAIYEGLGVTSSAGVMTPQALNREINIIKDLGFSGVTIFSWSVMTREHMRVLERA